MARNRAQSPAAVQYRGEAGITQTCTHAVVELLQCRTGITKVRILSCFEDRCRHHCLILSNTLNDLIVVKSGFTSGYLGEGPRGFSFTLALLEAHQIPTEEYDVSPDLMRRVEDSALTTRDLEELDKSKPIRPTRWYDYIFEEDHAKISSGRIWEDLDPIMPFAIIDPRLVDLALTFWDSPDERLLTGYRRLEDIVRARTRSSEHGARLFSNAFLGKNAALRWDNCGEVESAGRGNLFTAVYSAFRNPRAHREMAHEGSSQLVEFLLLNQLFLLERDSVECAEVTACRS